jgi:AbrB family looped-hinge helix DNA binding protein
MNNMNGMHNPTHAQGESAHSDGRMDMVTLGERGQVVIPSAIRENLSLKPGDKLMVFTKHSKLICLVPASSMRHLVNVLTAQLEEIETSQTDDKQENN